MVENPAKNVSAETVEMGVALAAPQVVPTKAAEQPLDPSNDVESSAVSDVAHDQPPQLVPTEAADPPPVSTNDVDVESNAGAGPQPPEQGSRRSIWRSIWRWAFPGRRSRLSSEELHERLELKSIGVIEEIHALALRQIATEEQRESRLDGKAQGLLISASLALTVAFTFGGLLLQHPEYLDPLREIEFLGRSAAWAVVACYSVALLSGLAASYVAIRALYVRADYQGVDEHALLGKGILDIVDDQPGDGALAAYRRYAAAHYWQIAQHNSDIHEAKADRIKLGQRLFIGFLACLMLIGLGLGYSAYEKVQHPTQATRCTP
jgi:hypothetical protein